VHPYVDRPEMGSGALFVTNNDPQSAAKMAREIAQEYWDRRQEFEPEVWKAEAAIHDAIENQTGRSVLTEVADTCGGGSAGDCVAVLRALLDIDVNIKAIYPVVSPNAAALAIKAGVGSEVNLQIGAEIDKKWGAPVKIKGTVLNVSDGHFTYQGGLDRIKTKLENYGHQEYNNSQVKDLVQQRLDLGMDVLGRPFKCEIREDLLPKYLVNNKQKYKHLFNVN
jgi:microcystin degradation protein MlrC